MIKKIFLSILATAATVATLDFAIGTTLRHFYFTETSGFQYRTTYAMEKTTANILTFGSSRANHHYVPDVFEHVLHRSTYNVGRDAQGILFQTAMLKAIVRRHHPQVVVLEYDGDFEYRDGGYDRLTSLLPYYRDHPEVRPYVELKGPFEKAKLLSQIYPFNSEILSILIGNLELNKKRNFDSQGYSPLFGTWPEPIQFFDEDITQRVDTNKVIAFREFIDTARAAGAEVFVINSPIFKRFKTSGGKNIGKEICKEKGVAYLDYTHDEAFVGNSQLFKDIFHLNDTGAIKFSQLAAVEIGKRLGQKNLAIAPAEN
ncbi:hypothetical protein [Duganella vulcania]|uniref:SGNH/GDSL hydrolase family protein n=1 Tax=Duganella vulcania TaxID=2692166 RepID=A0A845GXF2_9BURK|nr:hypothetical protein [Duganella vulcania]MYM98002.1 hypothetical protein [Duganella vulcania]